MVRGRNLSRAPSCLNTRLAAGFCLYWLTAPQSTAKAAGEVQQVLGRCMKCKNATAESSCKYTRTKIRQMKREAGTNRKCFYSYFFCRENISLTVSGIHSIDKPEPSFFHLLPQGLDQRAQKNARGRAAEEPEHWHSGGEQQCLICLHHQHHRVPQAKKISSHLEAKHARG